MRFKKTFLLAVATAAASMGFAHAAAAAAPVAASKGMWLSTAEVAQLPMSGTAWSALKKLADGDIGRANVADQSNMHSTRAFGVALVYARTGEPRYREKARAAIMSAIGTEAGARTLAVARNMAGYVLAADMINLAQMSATDEARFRSWIAAMRTHQNTGNARWPRLTLTSDNTASNWGAFATASRIAIDLYLGDTGDLAKAAQIHRAYADRSAYPAGKPWGAYFQPTADFDAAHWACGTSSTWIAINPACSKSGYNIDGAFVEDISREDAERTLLPQPSSSAGVSYSWETMQGVTFQAELLRRAGLPSLWELNGQALKRAALFLQRAGWHEQWSVTSYLPWLINKRYGTALPTRPAGYGRVVGFTDWTHAR